MRTIKQKVQTITPQVKDGCAERNCSDFCCGKSSKLDPDFGSVIITSITNPGNPLPSTTQEHSAGKNVNTESVAWVGRRWENWTRDPIQVLHLNRLKV
jgi:hypothetical protein